MFPEMKGRVISVILICDNMIKHFDRNIIYRNPLSCSDDIYNNPYASGTVTYGASTGFSVINNVSCLDFDASNTNVITNFTNPTIFQNGFSAAFWIYPEGWGENGRGRILDKSTVATYLNGFAIYIVQEISGTPNTIAIKISGGADAHAGDNAIVINTPKRYLVTVAAAGTVNWYINGVLVRTASTSACSEITTSNPVTIGNRNGDTDRAFDGKIGDVKIWKTVLTSEEASLDFKNAMYIDTVAKSLTQVVGSDVISGWDFTSGWTAMYGATVTGANTYTSTEGSYSFIYKNLGLVTGKRYLLTINGSASAGSFKILTGSSFNITNGYNPSYNTTFTFTALASSIYFVSSTTASTVTITTFTIQPITQESGSLLCDINALKGAIVDSSGLRTITNTETTTKIRDNMNIINFNGSTSKLDLGSDFIGTGDITVSAWIYPITLGESNTGFIIYNNRFYMWLNGTNRVSVTSSGGGYSAFTSNNAITLNAWNHIVLTRTSNGTANFYINGVLSGTANQNSGTPAAGTTHVIIGNNSGQTNTFDGYFSRVRVYSRILNTEEIKQMYTSSKWMYGY